MLDNKKTQRLKYYLEKEEHPLLIDFLPSYSSVFKENTYIIKANCKKEELEGFYTDKYNYPNWYKFLDEKKDDIITYLIIDTINSTKEEQKRFIGIVKDKTYQTLTIPRKTKIIVITNNINSVDKELLSYLIKI